MRVVAFAVVTLPALLGAAVGQAAPTGVAIERTVKRTCIDWLDHRQEVQRKELVLVKGSNLAIVDLTFGERLIIRSDQKKIWRADVLAGEYAEFTFDEAAALRKAALDDVRAARARVPGTPEEKDLDRILEGFDLFAKPPQVELKSNAAQREILLNGDLVRVSVQVNAKLQAPGWMDALAGVGAFHPAVAEKVKDLGGIPMKGTLRYALFLDRIVEQFEVTGAQPREIPDVEFELPKGLTRVPLRGFEAQPERKLSKPPQVNRSFKEDEGDKPKPAPPESKGK